MTISHASFAISVPAMPSANPTSASLSAGASFVPSPVTATTSPKAFCTSHNISLSDGDERASTLIFTATASCSALLILRNTGPSRMSPSSPSTRIPASRAIASAVSALSPVTMRTVTPAFRSSATASAVSGRIGSLIPAIPINVRFSSGGLSGSSVDGSTCISEYAMQSVRRPREAICVIASSALLRSSAPKGSTVPSAIICFVQSFTTISDAPLQCRRVPCVEPE
eukprot:30294-Pelagococcus_subviridis.AAC.76